MEYVMVPVPEELEDQVRQFLAWRRMSAGKAGWSEESMGQLFEQLDGPARAALLHVAQGVVDEEPVTVDRVARATGLTRREVLGIVWELVRRLKALGSPFPFLLLESEEDDDGARKLVLPGDGAQLALAIAQRA